MSISRIAFIGALLLATSTGAGCTLEAASAEETDSAAAALTGENFRLYDEPFVEPGGLCDIHTLLTLAPEERAPGPNFDGLVRHARLHDALSGECRRLVDPDPRTYTLMFEGTSCGSRIFTASITVDGVARKVTLTDHRTRVCKDLVPANVIVEEQTTAGDVRTLYSYDGRRAPVGPDQPR